MIGRDRRTTNATHVVVAGDASETGVVCIHPADHDVIEVFWSLAQRDDTAPLEDDTAMRVMRFPLPHHPLDGRNHVRLIELSWTISVDVRHLDVPCLGHGTDHHHRCRRNRGSHCPIHAPPPAVSILAARTRRP